jgi:hypothetical protein
MLDTLDDLLLEHIFEKLPLAALAAVSATCRRLQGVLWPTIEGSKRNMPKTAVQRRLLAAGLMMARFFGCDLACFRVPKNAWRSLRVLHVEHCGVNALPLAELLAAAPNLVVLEVTLFNNVFAREWLLLLFALASHKSLQRLRVVGVAPPETSAIDAELLESCRASTDILDKLPQLWESHKNFSVGAPLASVVFISVPVVAALLEALSVMIAAGAFPALRDINADNTTETDFSLPAALPWAIPSFLTLHELSLQGHDWDGSKPVHVQGLRMLLVKAPLLRRLFLGWCKLTDAAATLLAEGLRHFGNHLTELYLPCNRFTGAGLAVLANALTGVKHSNSSLRTLNISYNMGLDAIGSKALGEMLASTALEFLTLDGLHGVDFDAMSAGLAARTTSSRLRHLSLDNCHLHPVLPALRSLINNHLSSVNDLGLDHNHIADDELAELLTGLQTSALERVSLHGNHLTAESLPRLHAWGLTVPCLKLIDLSANELDSSLLAAQHSTEECGHNCHSKSPFELRLS